VLERCYAIGRGRRDIRNGQRNFYYSPAVHHFLPCESATSRSQSTTARCRSWRSGCKLERADCQVQRTKIRCRRKDTPIDGLQIDAWSPQKRTRQPERLGVLSYFLDVGLWLGGGVSGVGAARSALMKFTQSNFVPISGATDCREQHTIVSALTNMQQLAPEAGDWSEAEQVGIERLRVACRTVNYLEIDCDRTDVGDPWCIVYDRHQNRILIHIARIDRRYVVVCPVNKRSRRTATMDAAIDIAFAELRFSHAP
jgi:hypothetical protein